MLSKPSGNTPHSVGPQCYMLNLPVHQSLSRCTDARCNIWLQCLKSCHRCMQILVHTCAHLAHNKGEPFAATHSCQWHYHIRSLSSLLDCQKAFSGVRVWQFASQAPSPGWRPTFKDLDRVRARLKRPMGPCSKALLYLLKIAL